jgi:hypothetical protein
MMLRVFGWRQGSGIHAWVLPSGITLGKTHPGNVADSEVIIFDRFGIPRTKNWAFALLTVIVQGDREGDPVYCIVVSRNRVRDGIWAWDAEKKDFGCIKQQGSFLNSWEEGLVRLWIFTM